MAEVLTPEAYSLLEAIAKSESAGKWNVIYGGSTFSDYSKHPRKYVTIKSGPNKGKKSSAAGKYQILASTYDRVAPKLGITDFSPESQKQIAWYLAQEAYGPGLQEALEQGDLQSVSQRLAPVWTSLPGGIEQGTNSNKFRTAYADAMEVRGKMIPPAAIPASMSDDTRLLRSAYTAQQGANNPDDPQADLVSFLTRRAQTTSPVGAGANAADFLSFAQGAPVSFNNDTRYTPRPQDAQRAYATGSVIEPSSELLNGIPFERNIGGYGFGSLLDGRAFSPSTPNPTPPPPVPANMSDAIARATGRTAPLPIPRPPTPARQTPITTTANIAPLTFPSMAAPPTGPSSRGRPASATNAAPIPASVDERLAARTRVASAPAIGPIGITGTPGNLPPPRYSGTTKTTGGIAGTVQLPRDVRPNVPTIGLPPTSTMESVGFSQGTVPKYLTKTIQVANPDYKQVNPGNPTLAAMGFSPGTMPNIPKTIPKQVTYLNPAWSPTPATMSPSLAVSRMAPAPIPATQSAGLLALRSAPKSTSSSSSKSSTTERKSASPYSSSDPRSKMVSKGTGQTGLHLGIGGW